MTSRLLHDKLNCTNMIVCEILCCIRTSFYLILSYCRKQPFFYFVLSVIIIYSQKRLIVIFSHRSWVWFQAIFLTLFPATQGRYLLPKGRGWYPGLITFQLTLPLRLTTKLIWTREKKRQGDNSNTTVKKYLLVWLFLKKLSYYMIY